MSTSFRRVVLIKFKKKSRGKKTFFRDPNFIYPFKCISWGTQAPGLHVNLSLTNRIQSKQVSLLRFLVKSLELLHQNFSLKLL